MIVLSESSSSCVRRTTLYGNYAYTYRGTCFVVVPPVTTGDPWKGAGKGRAEVIEGPGQDDVIVTVQEEHNDGRGPTNT